MGCNCECLHKNPESKYEMTDGIIPGLGVKGNFNEIKNIITENDYDLINENKSENNDENMNNNDNINDKEKNSVSLILNQDEKRETDNIFESLKNTNLKTEVSRNNPKRQITYDSSMQSKIQELYESIFDYFNEVRTNPENFKKIAEEHNVGDVIEKVIDSSYTCNNLIINSYYNLLLSSYINNFTNDGEDNNKLLEEIEKEEKIKNCDKKLFVVDGDINNPNEVVWKLIKDNKDISYETFFSNSIEFIVISCQPMLEEQKFKSYFLLLFKKN